MHRNRFEFALERLDSGDWQKFEQLASTFQAAEYPSLRTMASPSGDRGRDAVLFSPSDDSSVLFQYSVTKNWQTKIRQTAKRISEEFDEPAMLIYVTNQLIGAQADDLRRDLWKEYRLSDH